MGEGKNYNAFLNKKSHEEFSPEEQEVVKYKNPDIFVFNINNNNYYKKYEVIFPHCNLIFVVQTLFNRFLFCFSAKQT